jgi:hypothetical protein
MVTDEESCRRLAIEKSLFWKLKVKYDTKTEVLKPKFTIKKLEKNIKFLKYYFYPTINED